MWLIRPPVTSKAKTVTIVLPSCAIRPGLAVDDALEDAHARRTDGQVGQVAGDLLGALDRRQRGGSQPAAVGGDRGVRVEQGDQRPRCRWSARRS
jgi:hypothetical protein